MHATGSGVGAQLIGPHPKMGDGGGAGVGTGSVTPPSGDNGSPPAIEDRVHNPVRVITGKSQGGSLHDSLLFLHGA